MPNDGAPTNRYDASGDPVVRHREGRGASGQEVTARVVAGFQSRREKKLTHSDYCCVSKTCSGPRLGSDSWTPNQ